MQNFSFLACLKAAEKCVSVSGGWVEHMDTMSNLNGVCVCVCVCVCGCVYVCVCMFVFVFLYEF